MTTHILKEEVGKSQMLYCTYQARYPVEYLSSGNLVSSDGFLHARRNIDSFVLIIVREGTLHITQNEVPFSVGPNQSILLIPDVTHYGHQPSSGPLSYYWTHFYITDPDWRVYNHNALLRYNETARQLFSRQPVPGLNQVSDETIILPEYFHLPPEKRSFILFAQLLDLADAYIETDLDADTMKDLASYTMADKSYTMPGTSIEGKTHDEFYVDDDAFVPILLELYYNKK